MRITNKTITFFDSNNNRYYVSVIESVSIDEQCNPQYQGRIVGHSGWGWYEDFIVDAGDFVFGCDDLDEKKQLNTTTIPNFRSLGIHPLQVALRNTAAKKEAAQKNVPLFR